MTCWVKPEQSSAIAVRPPHRYGTPSSRRTRSTMLGPRPFASARVGIHPPPVGKLDRAKSTALETDDHAAVPEQRAHERPATGLRRRLGVRDDDARPGLPLPRSRPARGRADEPPAAAPAAIAVRPVLDSPPGAITGPAQHAHNLAEQELTPQLALVVRPAAQIEGRQGHDGVGGIGDHSNSGLSEHVVSEPITIDEDEATIGSVVVPDDLGHRDSARPTSGLGLIRRAQPDVDPAHVRTPAGPEPLEVFLGVADAPQELEHGLVLRGIGIRVALPPEVLPALLAGRGRQVPQGIDVLGIGDVGERLEDAVEVPASRGAALLDVERPIHLQVRLAVDELDLEDVATDEQVGRVRTEHDRQGRAPHGQVAERPGPPRNPRRPGSGTAARTCAATCRGGGRTTRHGRPRAWRWSRTGGS